MRSNGQKQRKKWSTEKCEMCLMYLDESRPRSATARQAEADRPTQTRASQPDSGQNQDQKQSLEHGRARQTHVSLPRHVSLGMRKRRVIARGGEGYFIGEENKQSLERDREDRNIKLG